MRKNLIPKISQKIERILEREKLKPEISPQEFIKKTKGEKHRYSSCCLTEKGEKIFFYARIQDNNTAKRKVKKETIFAKKISKEKFRKKLPLSPFLPRYYKGKIEKDFEWFEREFLEKEPLGENELLKREPKKREISQIVDFLFSLKKTNLNLLKGRVPLDKFPLKNYRDLPYLLRNLRERRVISEEEYLSGKNFIRKHLSLFKKERKYLSHEDFNLGNIIFDKGKLKVIDWESMGINNFAYDISYLFCHLWQAKKWQRRYLVEKYLSKLSENKKEVFKILFRGNLLFLLGGGILAKPKEIKVSQLKERREFFLYGIKVSVKGFDEILLI